MRRWVLLLAALGLFGLGVVVLDRLFPPDLSRLASGGTELRDHRGRVLALLPAAGGVWRFRADVDQVAPVLRDLLIAVEDRRFWWHPGVDPLALARASLQWARAGRVISGGSTLSMQAARLLEPRPRTLGAKLIEMARALQLQARFGKRGVLEIWLTLAPYGGNLEGVRAGSLAWFGVPPEALEPAQAALLVAIPRRPEALRPDRHPARAAALRDRVLAVGLASGLFEAAAPAPVPTTRVALPRHAPQAMAALAASWPGAAIWTTLDRPLQAALERLAAERLFGLPDRVSLAILVADAPTREIRALFGGAWGDTRRAGSLDLTRAVRSPGSALKPLIYGFAFQDGLAAPDSVLGDLPRQFGGYAPENFDRGFAGTITAGEALRRSLNLPAVALLDRVGPVRFMASLKAAGVRLVLPDGADPSLPLALGGVGITLRDLTGLYAALATDGRFAALRLVSAPEMARLVSAPEMARLVSAPEMARLVGEAGRPLLGGAYARLVADVLTHPFPGGGPGGVAWKTGTSWGGRDAWALGFDARHVVGVWIGRPDGTPIPGASGLSLALPLLTRVFDLLPGDPRQVERLARGPAMPGLEPAAADSLRLLFPPPGAVLSADGQVTIRVMGGRRPLTFLLDGAPLPAEAVRREATWRPASPGFYRLTVLDADGAAAQARVRVR
jgi:penicillin-binding protein 1C